MSSHEHNWTVDMLNDNETICSICQVVKTTPEYDRGYADAIEMVLDVVGEMYNSYNFHNPTLDELEQRIV